MSQAIFNQEEILTIDSKILDDLKQKAAHSEMRRIRLCLHDSPDALVHEMINVFYKDSYIRPHRHPAGKPETYHMLEGEMLTLIFNDTGEVLRKIHLSEKGKEHPFLIRTTAGIWHMPIPLSSQVVFKETFTGPFVKETDVEYASWSPAENDAEKVAVYMRSLKAGFHH